MASLVAVSLVFFPGSTLHEHNVVIDSSQTPSQSWTGPQPALHHISGFEGGTDLLLGFIGPQQELRKSPKPMGEGLQDCPNAGAAVSTEAQASISNSHL